MSKDGGPAFPEVFSTYSNEDRTLTDVYSAGGMSLRDYFAAAAMQGVLAGRTSWPETPYEMAQGAEAAYDVADAMLKAREQSGGDTRE